ncbi:hypothetical protein LJR009_002308 [Bosea sp. LjRoot9]|uniref:hypothetical protein n=1 Tax=Bosea sp. LjRoot9 TaxID=3342341 RepID=UPI003ED10484
MIAPAPNPERSSKKTFDEWRESLAVNLSGRAFPALSRSELYGLELFPGCPLGGTVYVVPKSMVPAGPASILSMRSVDLMSGVPPATSRDPEKLGKVLDVLRIIVVAALLIPRESRRRRGHLPKPGTWVQFCRRLLRFSAWALTHRPNKSTVFAHLTFGDFAEAVKCTSSSVGWALSEVSKLRTLEAVVDWPDFPIALANVYKLVGMPEPIEKQKSVASAGDGHAGKPDEQGDTADEAQVLRSRERFKPLPDRFVTEAGWRVIWFVENLGPNIIRLHGRLRDKPSGLDSRSMIKWRAKILEDHRWRDPHGRPIDEIPFKIILSQKRKSKPIAIDRIGGVTTEEYVFSLAYLLQLCHIYIVSFCMGSRVSELFSLHDESLDERKILGGDGRRVTGHTYKLVEIIGGKDRDWPIHPFAAAAIRQQNCLVSGMRRPGVHALWIQFKASATGAEKSQQGDPLKSLNLNRLVEMLDLRDYVDERGLHHHRFRKTLARLGALALVGSPKILMDLFGHSSIKMTLFDYILADTAIAAEMDQVAHDMILLNAKEVLVTSHEHGGRAGARLKGFPWGKPARGEAELRVTDIDEAAKIVTLNGSSWIMVRSNVLCTKGPQQVGPCTRAVGHPDTSRCQPDCDRRLELNAARSDVSESISMSVSKLAAIKDWGDNYEALFWIGQLRHHLLRFEDVTALWDEHPIIIRLRKWEAAHLPG